MAEKHSIGLRESREANYWARIGASDPSWTKDLKPIITETQEFIAMLTASVRKLRRPQIPGGSLALLVFSLLLPYFLLTSYLLPSF
jgi:hypothetical protein